MVCLTNFEAARKTLWQVLWIALAGLLIVPPEGFCQSDIPKFEAAGHYVFMHYPGFDESESGLGGRFTYNINRFLAVEGELDLFPQERPVLNGFHDPEMLDYTNSRRIEGLFGVKAGIRRHRFGFFGKARPGFFYISGGERYIDPDVRFIRAPEEATRQFKFAMDLGGIAEVYLSDRSFIRIDAGDTIIKFTRSPLGDVGVRDFISHNLQLNIGWGFRF